MNIFIALGLTFVVLAVARAAFDYRVPGLAVIAVYLALYFAVERFRGRGARAKYADEPAPDHSGWPTSGPVGRLGQPGLMAVWMVTNTLAVLNPFQLAQVLRQLAGNEKLKARERATGRDGNEDPTEVRYSLPFEGEWLVYNGGNTPKTSHSWEVLGQRFALDFVIADDALRRHTGRGTRAEDYFCYDRPILAAADGEVVAVEDRVGQAPFLGWGVCDFTARNFIGNHAFIRHGPREFALYAHLVRGSVQVRPGDKVVRGQVIGRCGHTGHSSEPHLHFHVQDSDELFEGMGRPIRFASLSIDGRPAGDAVLVAGNRVRSAAPSGP